MISIKTIYDSIHMSLATVARILSQIIILPIMAQYLTPEDYGVIGVTMPLIFFFMVFADLGISASLVRKNKLDQLEWSSIYWSVFILGILNAIIVITIGATYSTYNNDNNFFDAILALAFIIPMQSLCLVPIVLCQRNESFSYIANIDIISTIFSMIIAVIMAIYGYGFWALIFQQLTYYFLKCLCLNLLHIKNIKITINHSYIFEHLKFGSYLAGSDLIHNTYMVLRNVMIQTFFGLNDLGLITMAENILNILSRVVSSCLDFIFYPKLSRYKNNINVLSKANLLISRIVSIIFLPATILIFSIASPLTEVLFSDKWTGLSLVIMILLPTRIMLVATLNKNMILMLRNRTKFILRCTLERNILSVLTILLSYPCGLSYCLISLTIVNVLYTIRPTHVALRLINLKFINLIELYIFPIIIATLSVIVLLFLESAYDIDSYYMVGIYIFTSLLLSILLALFNFNKFKTDITFLNSIGNN